MADTSTAGDANAPKQTETLGDVSTMSRESMKALYEKLIAFNLGGGKADNNMEAINILNDYRWTLHKVVKASGSNAGAAGQIPFAYIKEYKQIYSSQITNTINSLFALRNVDGNAILQESESLYSAAKNIMQSMAQAASTKVDELTGNGNAQPAAETTKNNNNLSNIASSTLDVATNAASYMYNSAISWLKETVTSMENIYSQSHLRGSALLWPYLFLYATAPTNKYYIMPVLTSDAAKFALTNQFSDSAGNQNKQTQILQNNLTDMLASVPTAITQMANDFLQAADMIHVMGGKTPDSSSFVNNWVEMGKFYNYSTEGDTFKISFPLFNTVGKDEWIRHHRFIYGFAIRNMPFKLDNASYKQPLLYDVVVPGVKRMPFAFVKSFTVEPKGIVRTIQGSNYITEILSSKKINSNIAYNIPEAWMVTIEFQDLIAPSANKLLSGLGDLNIETSTVVNGQQSSSASTVKVNQTTGITTLGIGDITGIDNLNGQSNNPSPLTTSPNGQTNRYGSTTNKMLTFMPSTVANDVKNLNYIERT